MQATNNQSHHLSPATQQPQQSHGTSIQNLANFAQPDANEIAQPQAAQHRSQQEHQYNHHAAGGHQQQQQLHQPQAQQNNQQHAHQQQQQGRSDRVTKNKYSLEDFSLQRTLGTGSFGRVHLVQSTRNHRFYAMKVLKKAQVVKMKQIEHTNDERKMLSRARHPFLITLWGTWQDSRNLYMVMDFVEGGELFSLLRKSQVCSLCCLWSKLKPQLTPMRSDSPTPLPSSMPPR